MADLAQILQGISEGIRTGTSATNNQPVPNTHGRTPGILDILGMLTKASKLKDSSGMDQWGNPVPVTTAPRNPGWDMLTGGGGARAAAELNKRRSELEQGIRLAQLQQALDLEKERLKGEEGRKTEQERGRQDRKKERVTGKETRKTIERGSDVKLGADRQVSSGSLRDLFAQTDPTNIRSASSEALNRGLLSESEGRLLRGQPTDLAEGYQTALGAGLTGRMVAPAADVASKLRMETGPGGIASMPSLTNLVGLPNTLEGSSTTRSSVGEGMRFLPGGGIERTPQTMTERWQPGGYFSAPITPDSAAVLEGKQKAARRIGDVDLTQPEAPAAPAGVRLLQSLSDGIVSPTAQNGIPLFNPGGSIVGPTLGAGLPNTNAAPAAMQEGGGLGAVLMKLIRDSLAKRDEDVKRQYQVLSGGR